MSSSSPTDSRGVVIRCEGCEKAYRIHPEKVPAGVSSFPCRACGALISLAPVQSGPSQAAEGGSVLIAIEEDELGKLIQRILSGSGFRGDLAGSGKQALEALTKETSDLLLVSVYLPDMMGYELLDRVAGEQTGKRIPSILLSAVHHATRYKRAPTSLYGADDYLERHHLPDLLIPKVRRLLTPGEDTPERITPENVPPPTDEQVMLRRDLEVMERSGRVSADPKMGEIQRMCRVIVGDIALYNEDILASTEPAKMLEAIAPDLTEGESLLMSKFPEMEDQLSHLLKAEMVRLLSSRGIQIS